MTGTPMWHKPAASIGGLAVAAAVALTACTAESPTDGPPATPSPSATGRASGLADMSKNVQRADAANKREANTVIIANARPTVAEENAELVTMVIRDEAGDTWVPGKYRLVVSCSGQGSLYAYFRIGGASEIRELAPCIASGATAGEVDIQVTSTTAQSAIWIIPAGDTNAAVSYQVQRL